MLIPNLQLCLAHYCDVHGPTPLMVTEGLPVPCSVCFEDDLPVYSMTGGNSDRPRTSTPATSHRTSNPLAESLRRLSLASAQRSSSVPASEQDAQVYRAAILRSAQGSGTGSAIETPPQSPRHSSEYQSQQQKPRHDSGFRRTYDDYVTRRAGPCENCALTLPRRQESPTTSKGAGFDSRPDRGPTLRTRAPCAKVYGSGADGSSTLSSEASSSSPSEDEAQPQRRRTHHRADTTASMVSRSTASTASQSGGHIHYLDYTSTHEPVTPSTFSIVRASCLRTLSFETLPRPPATGVLGSGSSTSTPTASPVTPAFVTTHSAGSAASGGPIFFGDPTTGYTTAYIFRIPDVHARGHKRVYAFLALSTHREHLAMKSFSFIAAAFRDMATWIQTLAESEAERAGSDGWSSASGSPVVANPGYGGLGSHPDLSGSSMASGGGSSFLTGGMGGLSRRMGGGLGGSSVALKQRGLAELVGMPDFFLELHSRFVRLLLELGVVQSS